MEERKPEEWYDYHETEWETIVAVSLSESKCYLVKVLPRMSDHAIEQVLIAKGFDLKDIDWYKPKHV